MKAAYVIAGVGLVGFGALVLWYSRRSGVMANRNDAAGPRLAGMPEMPLMPSIPAMPTMPAMGSAAAPNAPRIGPQVPEGMFAGMWK